MTCLITRVIQDLFQAEVLSESIIAHNITESDVPRLDFSDYSTVST